MTLRSALQGLGIGIVGVAFALAPVTAAAASNKQSKNHSGHHSSSSKKGSHPRGALCTDLKAEEANAGKIGLSISKALGSGNFAAAKQALITAFNADLKASQPAAAQLRSAPANVQAAFKAILNELSVVKSAIANASNLPALESSFLKLGQSPKLTAASATLTNYITAQCGSLTTTTTT